MPVVVGTFGRMNMIYKMSSMNPAHPVNPIEILQHEVSDAISRIGLSLVLTGPRVHGALWIRQSPLD